MSEACYNATQLDIRYGVESVMLIGNGAKIDDDDVLIAITIQDVLVLLSSGEEFPAFDISDESGDEPTRKRPTTTPMMTLPHPPSRNMQQPQASTSKGATVDEPPTSSTPSSISASPAASVSGKISTGSSISISIKVF